MIQSVQNHVLKLMRIAQAWPERRGERRADLDAWPDRALYQLHYIVDQHTGADPLRVEGLATGKCQ